VHHAAAANFDPFLAALERLRFHIDLEARLGERKIMGAKTHRGVGPEKLAQKIFERPLEVGHAHPVVDVQTFDLVKLRAVGRVDFVATEGGAGRDHPNRRRG
jgi:hypothetical protein